MTTMTAIVPNIMKSVTMVLMWLMRNSFTTLGLSPGWSSFGAMITLGARDMRLAVCLPMVQRDEKLGQSEAVGQSLQEQHRRTWLEQFLNWIPDLGWIDSVFGGWV